MPHTAHAHLVERDGAGQDHVRVLHLHDALPEPNQIRADPDRAARHLATETKNLLRSSSTTA